MLGSEAKVSSSQIGISIGKESGGRRRQVVHEEGLLVQVFVLVDQAINSISCLEALDGF